MKPRGRVLGPAHTHASTTTWGTAAADDAEVVKDQPSPYELADIDRDRYTILAVNLSIDGPVTATLMHRPCRARDRRHHETITTMLDEAAMPVLAHLSRRWDAHR